MVNVRHLIEDIMKYVGRLMDRRFHKIYGSMINARPMDRRCCKIYFSNSVSEAFGKKKFQNFCVTGKCDLYG